MTYLFTTEFSFLITHYNLLYQSIIPNPKLTITTLSRHLSIDENVTKYIYDGSTHRIQCQRILNFLLVNVADGVQDYMQFCYCFGAISVLTYLPYKIIGGMYMNKYRLYN